MEKDLTAGERNLELFKKSLPKSERLYIWSFMATGKLLAADCPHKEALDAIFAALDGKRKMMQYAAKGGLRRPVVIGTPIGMQWAVTAEKERGGELIFVIGPVFYQKPFESEVRRGLRQLTYTHENAAAFSELIHLLPEIPVMSYAAFSRYAVMVHNLVNGEELDLAELEAETPEAGFVTAKPEERDRTHIYMTERAMLQVVKNGDLDYASVLQNSVQTSPGVPVRGADPLRQAKTSILVFTTLVCRAAMEGGLSPEIAYPMGDAYIQAVEDCRDSAELSSLAHNMYRDFVYSVHKLRANPDYSYAVQKCCDYIELSLENRIRTSELAALCGYSEYYLTEKFKKETGQSISEYIRCAKVERAKLLLVSGNLSIREIAERLAFNTPNYFIKCFRDIAGYTPAQYRKRFQGQ